MKVFEEVNGIERMGLLALVGIGIAFLIPTMVMLSPRP
jgi:predicted RND superfamily exporter protein